ncbi:uncharacterized protein LOC115746443 [Rhodamnia argentea]|uniref:Uncharacterized protein LOC115746443 n=1 Tax=Rhodamnia argentea TaxID=178133 RepID=A0ABM3H4U4_9MYRT|nr:uncharacterized protein LOC115746443 [Rhodamnia argentea]
MASSIIFMTLALVAAIVPVSVMGTEFMVGDDKGWTLNFDYQAWAEGKQFYVGDKLVFKYPGGAHNVLKVNGTGFQECVAPAGTVALTTGNDVITLLTPGRKWYICGVGKHCASGNMKLVITVLPKMESPEPEPAPAPAAAEASAAGGSIVPRYYASIMAVLGVIATVMFLCLLLFFPTMASSIIFVTLALLAAFGPATVMGIEFMVGDDRGWTLNFDYQAWAEGKQFYVGDKLVFMYPQGAHNVLKVNGTGFQQCAAPAGTVALTTGSDVIPLLTPGRKWYICGIGNHCAAGNMKLVITVLPKTDSPTPTHAPAPAPVPAPAPAAAKC